MIIGRLSIKGLLLAMHLKIIGYDDLMKELNNRREQ